MTANHDSISLVSRPSVSSTHTHPTEDRNLAISIPVRLSPCLSVHEHIPETSLSNFANFLHMLPTAVARSVLLWLCCNILCTSGFVDDAIFLQNEPYGARDTRGV